MDNQKLSVLVEQIFNSDAPKTTLGELVKKLDTHGFAVVMVMFSLPSALPIPAPGYSTLLSIPLMLIGISLLLGRHEVWVPQKIGKREIKPSALSPFINKIKSFLQKIERISKPRWDFVFAGGVAQYLVGGLICLLACSMALPLPLTNTLPAGGIFLIGLSFLERDGLLFLAGALWSVLALCITAGVIFFGSEAVKFAIKELL